MRRSSDPAETTDSANAILLGSSEIVPDVRKVLGRLRVRVRTTRTSDEALGACDESSLVLCFVAPLDEAHPEMVLRKIRARPASAELPVLVVVSEVPSRERARRLYRDGASAVLEWPREALLLPRLALELADLDSRRTPMTEGDRRLAVALRARIRLLGEVAEGVRLSVSGGVARLSGSVACLRGKREVEALVEDAPGVIDVTSREIVVRDRGVADGEIADSVRRVLCAAGWSSETVTATVTGGHVVLLGSAASRRDTDRLVELVEHVAGVRGVTSRIEIAEGRRRHDASCARRLDSLLASVFPDCDLHVSVLGGVAVLSGRVRLVSQRRDIERLVRRDPSVTRVVDKLEVRG